MNNKANFSILEVAGLMAKLAEARRENHQLNNQVVVAREELAVLRSEAHSLREQLADFESYYARERTKRIVVPRVRSVE